MRFKTLLDKNVRVNDFQMVEKGSNLYREVISYLNSNKIDGYIVMSKFCFSLIRT